MRRPDVTPPRSAALATDVSGSRSSSSRRVVRSALEVLAEVSPSPPPPTLAGPVQSHSTGTVSFATVTSTRNNAVRRVAPTAASRQGQPAALPNDDHHEQTQQPLFPSPERAVTRQSIVDMSASSMTDEEGRHRKGDEGEYISIAMHAAKLKSCLEAYDERRDEEERSVLRSVGKEVEELSARNDHLAITVEELTQHKANLTSNVERLKAQCEVLTHTVRELHAELQSERDRSSRLDVALCHTEDKCRLQASHLTQELDFEKAQFAVTMSDLRSTFDSERRRLEEELATRSAEAKELMEALKEIRQTHEHRAKDDDAKAKTITSLQSELSAAAGRQETVQRMLDTLKQTIDEKDTSLKKIAARAATLERQLAEKEQVRAGAVGSMTDKVRVLEDQLKREGEDLRKKLGRIAALESETKQKDETIMGLRGELTSRDERHALLHQAAESLTRSATRLVRRVENEFPLASDAMREALDSSAVLPASGSVVEGVATALNGKKRVGSSGKTLFTKQPPPFFVVGSNALQLLAHAQTLVDAAYGTVKDCGRALRHAVQRCQELSSEQTENQKSLEAADDATRREALVIVQRLQQDREDLRRQLGVLETQIVHAEREGQRYKSGLEAAETVAVDLRQQLRTSQQHQEEAEVERDAARRQHRAVSEELEALQGKQKQLRDRAEAAEGMSERLTRELTAQTAATEAAEAATALSKQALAEEKERSSRVVAGLRLEAKRLIKESTEAKSELQAANTNKSGRFAASAAATTAMEKELVTIRRSLESAKAELELLQSSNHTMQIDLQARTLELSTARKQLRATEQQAEKYKRRVNDSRETSLQAVMSLSSTAQACIETLSNAVAVWNATPSRKTASVPRRDGAMWTTGAQGSSAPIPFSVTDAAAAASPSSLDATTVELSPADGGGATPDPHQPHHHQKQRTPADVDGPAALVLSSRPVIDRLVATCHAAANVVLAAHKEAMGHQRELARRDELVAFLDAERRAMQSPAGNVVAVVDASPAAIVPRSSNKTRAMSTASTGACGSTSPQAPRWAASSSLRLSTGSDDHSPLPAAPPVMPQSKLGAAPYVKQLSQQSATSEPRGNGMSVSATRHGSSTRSVDGNSSPSKPPMLRSASASSSQAARLAMDSGHNGTGRRRAADVEPHSLVNACA